MARENLENGEVGVARGALGRVLGGGGGGVRLGCLGSLVMGKS